MAHPVTGPVVMTTTGDAFIEPAQIRAILWDGATTAGDTVELRERTSNNLLFVGRAVATQTWEGVVLDMRAPSGFRLSQISAGRLLVYLDEPE